MSVVIHPEIDDGNEEEEFEEDEYGDKEDITELSLLVEEAMLTHPSHLCCLISGKSLINMPLKSLPSVDMTKYLPQVSHQPHDQASFVEEVMKCMFV